MPKTIRVGVLRTELSLESQDEWLRLFPLPEFDLVFVPIFPRTPDELVDMLSTRHLDYVHLRPMTLVDKALAMNMVPLVMQKPEGLSQLKGISLDTEVFQPATER